MFVLPVSKGNPVRNIPWVVLSLIVANSLVMMAIYLLLSPEPVFRQYGFIPAQPRLASLLSSLFLHGGFWHLVGNMWFLWMFGNQVENMFGRWLFGLTYVVCGLGGHLLHYAFSYSSNIPCIGASGAISGIVGIYFVLFPKAKFDLVIYFGWVQLKTIPTSTHIAVGAWIGEQALLGIITQAFQFTAIAFWAHVGGFGVGLIAGFLFTWFVPEKRRRMMARAKPWYMRDQFNRDDDELTKLNLLAPDPVRPRKSARK